MSIISEIQNKALDEGRLKAEAVNSYKVVSVRPSLEITALIEVLSCLDGKSPSEFIYKNFGKALEDFTLSSNEHIECLKTALDNNDMETLKKRIGELEQAAAYMQQQQANQGATPNSNGSDQPAGSNPDDVVDADFTKKGDNNA